MQILRGLDKLYYSMVITSLCKDDLTLNMIAKLKDSTRSWSTMLKINKDYHKREVKQIDRLNQASDLVKQYKEKCISTKVVNGIVERDDTDRAQMLKIGKTDIKLELERLTEKLEANAVSECFQTMLNAVVF